MLWILASRGHVASERLTGLGQWMRFYYHLLYIKSPNQHYQLQIAINVVMRFWKRIFIMVFSMMADMQSQLVCSGCRSILLYPRGATNVCCAVCNTITQVPPPGTLRFSFLLIANIKPSISFLSCERLLVFSIVNMIIFSWNSKEIYFIKLVHFLMF